MNRWFRMACVVAMIAVVTVLTGCGGDAKTADVSGTVSYDGKPVEEGSISFIPADGKGPSGGGSIKDGKYTATRVPLGNMKVQITGTRPVGNPDAKGKTEAPGGPPPTQQYIPEKYNTKTELTFDVKSGASEKNWELAK